MNIILTTILLTLLATGLIVLLVWLTIKTIKLLKNSNKSSDVEKDLRAIIDENQQDTVLANESLYNSLSTQITDLEVNTNKKIVEIQKSIQDIHNLIFNNEKNKGEIYDVLHNEIESKNKETFDFLNQTIFKESQLITNKLNSVYDELKNNISTSDNDSNQKINSTYDELSTKINNMILNSDYDTLDTKIDNEIEAVYDDLKDELRTFKKSLKKKKKNKK